MATDAPAAPTFRASHRHAKTTARKARLVADLIRGLPVNAALRALDRSDKLASVLVGRVVRSAVANAEQDGNIDPNKLIVVESRVDEGPLLGGFVRWKAGSRGRSMPIRKRTAHIHVALSTVALRERAAEAPAPAATAAPAAAGTAEKPAKAKGKAKAPKAGSTDKPAAKAAKTKKKD
jgi:large subunit ribosomal protein L22